jgi:hypothetical protein
MLRAGTAGTAGTAGAARTAGRARTPATARRTGTASALPRLTLASATLASATTLAATTLAATTLAAATLAATTLAATLAVAVTLLPQGVAAAAVAGTPPGPGAASFASMAVPPKTFTATYSCDLSGYGSGTSPVTVSSTVIVPATVPTVTPVVITLKTSAVALPSSVLSQLSGVVSFDLAASVTAEQNGVTVPLPLTARSAVSGTPAGLPAATATSSADPAKALTFTLPGTARIEVPATALKFTPHTASAALTPITCTTTAAKTSLPVTVTDAVIGTRGPLYTFTESASVAPTVSVKLLEFRAHVPMRLTASGARTTGKTDTVAPVAGVGDIFQPGATSVRFSAALPVTGAQPGEIALSKTITDVTSVTTSASGRLRLIRAGTDRVLVPEKFTYTYKAPVQGITGLVSFVWTCTLTTRPVPVGLSLDVTKSHTQPNPSTSPTASPTASDSSSGNGGSPEGSGTPSGTPSGAPDTGGGTGPGADMAVAATGGAIAVSGGGLLLLGRRRNRRPRT